MDTVILRATPASRKARQAMSQMNIGYARGRCEVCRLAVYLTTAAVATLERLRAEGREFEVRCVKCFPVEDGERREESPEIQAAAEKAVLEGRRN